MCFLIWLFVCLADIDFFHVGKKIKMKISTCKVKKNRPDSLKSTKYLHYTCVLCQKSV